MKIIKNGNWDLKNTFLAYKLKSKVECADLSSDIDKTW